MLRPTALFIVAAGLSVGCASSTSQSSAQNPDDGQVQYDVGKADGDAADGGSAPGDEGGAEDDAPKGRDQTGTRGVGSPKKPVKKLAAQKPAREEKPAGEKPQRQGRVLPNGLLAAFYKIEAGATEIPDFSTLSADGVALVKNVDFPEGRITGTPAGIGASYAVNFTGSLNVTEAAEYRLCLKSSDGSVLFLDGTLIVDNSGVHPTAAETCELVYMDPGEYELNLQYFTVSNASSLQWSWAAGTGAASAVPESALYKPAGADDLVKKSKR